MIDIVLYNKQDLIDELLEFQDKHPHIVMEIFVNKYVDENHGTISFFTIDGERSGRIRDISIGSEGSICIRTKDIDSLLKYLNNCKRKDISVVQRKPDILTFFGGDTGHRIPVLDMNLDIETNEY